MSKHRHKTTVQSEMICTKCGTNNSILRNAGQLRKKEHIKHLYCYKCQERTEHKETHNFGGKFTK
jgi:transcription elongation factor Elf1